MPGSEEFLTYFLLPQCCLLVCSDSFSTAAVCLAFRVYTLGSVNGKARIALYVMHESSFQA